jgi:hypothetical protein
MTTHAAAVKAAFADTGANMGVIGTNITGLL